jgi:ADP-ribosylglycohydrolase
LKDRPADGGRPERKGVLAFLINRDCSACSGIDPDLRTPIDIKVAKALSRAMEQAGIRPSQKSRRVGDYILGDLIADGPGYQDRLGKHVSVEKTFRRVRQYTVAQASSEAERQQRRRAAEREFQILQTLDHPGILPVLDYKEHEHGPALLFRYLDPNAVRLDHFLAANCQKLSTDQRLDMLRQIADAIRYAHSKRIIHRALGPQSILVTDASSPTPKLQVYNWQVGIRETASTSGRVTNVEDLVEAQALVYMSPEAVSDSRKITEASDVFSLGAIAFHLFGSRPPASNPTELAKILRDQKGLSISSVLDGAGASRYVEWWKTGKYSVNGRCFDIGITTRNALSKFVANRNALASGDASERASGNGSIMRLAPVAIGHATMYPDNIAELSRLADESSLPTHASEQCRSACRYLATILAALVHGEDRETVLSPDWKSLQLLNDIKPLHPLIQEVAQGSFRLKQPPAIQGSGWVVRSLEASLWAFHNADTFEEAVLRAVNLGDDADTTGAICGQLAGANWGEAGISESLRSGLARIEMIEAALSGILVS